MRHDEYMHKNSSECNVVYVLMDIHTKNFNNIQRVGASLDAYTNCMDVFFDPSLKTFF